MAWVTIAIMVGVALIAAGRSYYQSRQNDVELEDRDFDPGTVPTVTESDPIPVVFGSPILRAPNVVFWAQRASRDFVTETINERLMRVRTHMVICQGPVERAAFYDDAGEPYNFFIAPDTQLVFNGNIIEIDQSVFQVSTEKTTWIEYLAFLPGFPNQVLPSRIAESIDDGDQPDYRGVFSIWVQNAFVGNMSTFWYQPTRRGIRSFGDEQWEPLIAPIGPLDMNPAHIIREVITDEQWGMRRPESEIDETSFKAAANALFSEGFGLSAAWATPGRYSEFIQEILRHIDGVLYEEPTTGKHVLRLIREDYDVEELEVFGPDDIISIQRQRPAAFELSNRVTVEYSDRGVERKRTVKADDQASQILRGTIQDTVKYHFCYSAQTASRLAARDLLSLSAPLASVEMRVPYSKGESLRPADVIIIEYPAKGIPRMVLRVSECQSPSVNDDSQAIVIKGVEDKFAFSQGLTSVPPAIDIPDPPLPSAPEQVGLELPLWLAYRWAQEDSVFTQLSQMSEEARSIMALAASTSDEANRAWRIASESSFASRRFLPQKLGFSPTVSLKIQGSGINYKSGTVDFETDGDFELLAGELLLCYLPDVSDAFGSFPQIVTIDPSTDQMQIGLFDTVTPAVFPEAEITGVVLGAIRWSASPTIRRTYGVDRILYPSGTQVDLSAITETITRILPEEDEVVTQVTAGRRMLRPYAPGNLNAVSNNDGAGGGVVFSFSRRNRLGSQRRQGDTPSAGEAGEALVVDVYETSAPYTSFTFLRSIIGSSIGATSTEYTNAQEVADRGDENLSDALLFVIFSETTEESLFGNTHLYIRT